MNKTAKCQHCDREVVLPFKCPYCNGYFCAEHRLPENHACPESWRARAPREEAPPIIVERGPTRPPYKYTITYAPQPTAKIFWFSTTELKHLTLGTLLVMGVGLSFIPHFFIGLAEPMLPEILMSLTIVFTFTFLLHELAHKLSAQRFGLWAEFRLTLMGALITFISMFSPLFKIVSPGAVMIAGSMDRETVGKTALAGPLTNLILSAIFTVFVLYPPSQFVRIVALVGAMFNAWIALFNLVPFGMLDGFKIFLWNKIIWVATFVLSIALTIFTYVYF